MRAPHSFKGALFELWPAFGLLYVAGDIFFLSGLKQGGQSAGNKFIVTTLHFAKNSLGAKCKTTK